MATRTLHGSCHCGAMTWQAPVDLAEPTARCNCRFCRKTRNWTAGVKPPSALKITGGEDSHGQRRRDFPGGHTIQHFCRTCGVQLASTGHIPQAGGDVAVIRIATIDDATEAELILAPIRYLDGLHDHWERVPDEVRYL